MKTIKFIIGVLLGLTMASATYITTPYDFVPKELISSTKVNANYNAYEQGLSDASKDVNLYRLYISGQKVIDYNRAITCTDLTITGNLTISGSATIPTISFTIATGNGVTTTTSGTTDANKIPRLNADGHLDDDLMPYDVYNFYVKYPYAAAVATETVQEQLFYANGTIVSCKAELGTDATGATFVVNLFNDIETVKLSTDTYTFSDVSDTVTINTSINTNTRVTANTALQLQVVQIGSTIAGQDLRVQVVVKRRD